MKRPLIGFTFMWAAGIFLKLHVCKLPEIIYQPWFIAFIFIIIVILHTVKNQYFIASSVLLAGLICGILFCNVYEQTLVNPVIDLNKRVHTVSAIVRDFPDIYDDCQRVKITVPKNQLKDKAIRQDVTTLIYLPKEGKSISPGDTISLSISWYIPTVKDGFDRFRYFKGEGIYILGGLQKDTSFSVYSPEHRPWWYYPKHFSQIMKESTTKVLNSRQSGFLNAILLGDTINLQDLDASHMRKAGVSHITSVSGLHISFLISFLLLFFGRKYGSIISVGTIIIFIVMVGWSPSVLRAGFMYIIFAISFWINRENDSLTALCAALLFILITNPLAIDSIGLQLSYSSTLGIILFSSNLQHKLMKPFQKSAKLIKLISNLVMSSLSCSLSAMIFTIPILLYSFGYMSILSPLANLLILWAVSIVFPLGLIMCVIYPIVPIVSQILSVPIGYLIDFILFATEKIANMPFGLTYAENKLALITIAIFYVTIILIHLSPKIFKTRYCIPILSVIIISVTWYGLEDRKTDSKITFLPSGYGQTIMVAAGKELALIDCSGSGTRNGAKSVIERMDWCGYDKINLLILSSVDKTHARNIPELLETTSVEKIIIPQKCRQNEFYNEILNAAKKFNIPVEIHQKDGEYQIGSPNLGVSLIGGIDRKLAVRIKNQGNEVLVLHSLTQKMQNQLLANKKLNAQTIVLGQSGLTDLELLRPVLNTIKPQNIIIESSFGFASKLFDIPVQNTFETGEIELKSKMITYKEQ